jgi:hypothetical protein
VTSPRLARQVKGRRRYFNPNRHNGNALYDSVTWLTKVITPYYLVDWAAKVTAEYAVSHSEDWRTTISAHDAVQLLASQPNVVRDAGGERGTATHEYLEDRFNGKTPGIQSGYQQAAENFLNDVQPVPEGVERTLFNEEHRYAGTTDFVGELRNVFPGRRVLADWKTSKTVYPEHELQLIAYAMCDYWVDDSNAEHEWQRPSALVDVLLKEDGSYTLHNVPIDDLTWKAFQACVTLKSWQAIGLNPDTLQVKRGSTPDELEKEAWLDAWVAAHPALSYQLGSFCLEKGIRTRRTGDDMRTPVDIEATIALIELLKMGEEV